MSIRVHQCSTLEFLHKVVQNHLFTSQLDVVFADSGELGGLLSALQTSYYRSTVTFAEVFSAFDAKNCTLALSIGPGDSWSIDHHATLTLSVTRETYECIGIAGISFGSKHNEMFLITLNLHDSSASAKHIKDRLRQWDARRAASGKDGWDVLLSSPLSSGIFVTSGPIVRVSEDVRIPSQTLPSIKCEDAHEELSMLFEWVGLASLGSQRLHANDAVNPYVASCSFPASWNIGTLTHVRWAGLLTSSFVQLVLDTCLRGAGGLVGITAMPVSRDGKGVWTLVASKSVAQTPETLNWVLAECAK